MGVLNSSGYFNGDNDKWIEKRQLMLEFFKGKALSVLIVDPNNEKPLEEIA